MIAMLPSSLNDWHDIPITSASFEQIIIVT